MIQGRNDPRVIERESREVVERLHASGKNVEYLVFDDEGELIRDIGHFYHRSNDVNSETGFTLHEHNHYVVVIDFVKGTVTQNGAINIMQRPGTGSVILNVGHKVFDFATGTPIVLRGPNRADDEDFCRAVAP